MLLDIFSSTYENRQKNRRWLFVRIVSTSSSSLYSKLLRRKICKIRLAVNSIQSIYFIQMEINWPLSQQLDYFEFFIKDILEKKIEKNNTHIRNL